MSESHRSRNLKALALLVLVASNLTCQAQEVQDGSYIVVRGALRGCEAWAGRVLQVVKVEQSKPVPLLGLPPLDFIGLSAEEISLVLQARIEALTGYRPRTVWVEILGTDEEYLAIQNDYQWSLHYLSEGTCPGDPNRQRGMRRDWQSPPNFNEEMRRAYGLIRFEQVV